MRDPRRGRRADSGFDGPCAIDTLCAASLERVSDELRSIFRRLRPTVVLTLDGCDGHRDHVHVRDAIDLFLCTDHLIAA